jgi:phosphoribosylglycinamide formyltransferase 1
MTDRIVVLVSGAGTGMQALAEACSRREVPADIVAVIADRDCPALLVARRLDIQAQIVEPASFPSREKWSRIMRDCVQGHRPDLVVCAGFMRVLDAVFVDAFYGRLINLHPSLLPSFPGAHAVRDALEAGVKVTGATIHFMTEDVDHGPILLQEAVRVQPGDNESSLHARIKNVEHRLLPQACRLILEGRVRIENGRVGVAAQA